jgi:hypothetical protein
LVPDSVGIFRLKNSLTAGLRMDKVENNSNNAARIWRLRFIFCFSNGCKDIPNLFLLITQNKVYQYLLVKIVQAASILQKN